MQIHYIGHSAFFIESPSIRALIDPFITGNPQATVTADSFENITHIFVTHGHGDHLGDTIPLALKHNALVIANFEICNYLEQHGLRTHSMHIGGRTRFDFGTVKMTPALHGSSISNEHGTIDGGTPCGFVLEIEGKKIYHAGDTGLTMDMKLLTQEQIDLALLPIGGNYTMDIEDAVRAVDFIQPKHVVPMHYNTFPVIKADPIEFRSLVLYAVVLLVNPGESFSL